MKGGKIIPRQGLHPACSENTLAKPDFRRSANFANTHSSFFKDTRHTKLMSKSRLEPSILGASRENSAYAEPELR